ncbi:MAG: peroxisomal biogenesis factor 11-domain-containing protein [Monoraphidium minutum]|nr:MAG: peroxisomal biogenesis factor 11-domain-containing protein [Monoraphidium minutum]
MDHQLYTDSLQVIKGFCAKADGKDKLTALVQYACLFASAGEPGNLKKVQASVTAARKVFRIMRPLEALTPLLVQPGFQGKQAWQLEAVAKLKDLLMAIYFAADHVVWAYQIGLVTDKAVGERFQKVSLWGWALGSVCTAALEIVALAEAAAPRKDGEGDAEWAKRQEAARAEVNGRLLVLFHALVQAGTAAGLLQVVSMRPRTVGLLGTVASIINCYFLMPAMPKRAPRPAPAPAPATAGGGLPAGLLAAADVAGKLVPKMA